MEYSTGQFHFLNPYNQPAKYSRSAFTCILPQVSKNYDKELCSLKQFGFNSNPLSRIAFKVDLKHFFFFLEGKILGRGFYDSTYLLSKIVHNMNSAKILILLHLKYVIKSICSLVPLSSKGQTFSKGIIQKVIPPQRGRLNWSQNYSGMIIVIKGFQN